MDSIGFQPERLDADQHFAGPRRRDRSILDLEDLRPACSVDHYCFHLLEHVLQR
jgi:hypothetical protein